MFHFKCPAENRSGLQIEIATSLTVLSVLEPNVFLLWVGICIEIVHTKFREPRWKIVVSATLESQVPKNSFFSEKRKLCSFFGAIICHQGSRIRVHNAKTYIKPLQKKYGSITLREVAIHASLGIAKKFLPLKALIVKFLLIASVNR